MMNNMGLGLMFTAKDMASGQMTQLENRFNTLDSQISETQKTFNRGMETFRKGLKTFSVGAGILATIGMTVKSASNLETAMIEVQKKTGMADDELEKLQNRFMELSQEMPASATELAKVGRIAGQLGIDGVDNIEKFTTAVTKLGVATDLSVEEGAEAMARLSNVLEIPIDEAERLGSVINKMANTSTATASMVVDSMRRMAGAGKTLGLTTDEIAGLSATLTDLGVRTRVGGTAMTQLFTRMSRDVDKFADQMGVGTSEFKEMIDENAVGAVQMLFEHMQGLDKYQKAQFLQEVGISSSRMVDALLKMSDGTETLEKHLKNANEAWAEGKELQREYETSLNALSAQAKILRNIFDIFVKRMGMAVIPLATGLVMILQTMGRIMNKIPQPILDVILTFTALVGITLTLAGAWMMAQGALTALIGFMATKGIITTATFGALLWQVLLPIGLIAAALVALRYAWEYNLFGIRDFLTRWWKRVKLIFQGLRQLFDPDSYGMLGEGLRDKLKEAGLLDTVVSIYTAVNKLKRAWENWGGVIKTLAGLFAIIQGILAIKKAWIATQTVLNAVMTANPIGLLIAGIALLITGIALLIKNWEKVKEVILNVWDTIWGFIKNGLIKAYNWIVDIINKIPDFLLPKSLENLEKIEEEDGDNPSGRPKTVPRDDDRPVSGRSVLGARNREIREQREREHIEKTEKTETTRENREPQPVVLEMDGKEVGKAVIDYEEEERELEQEEY